MLFQTEDQLQVDGVEDQRRMAEGPEAQADGDDPPSVNSPPLITVSDLPSATAAGNSVCLCVNCNRP